MFSIINHALPVQSQDQLHVVNVWYACDNGQFWRFVEAEASSAMAYYNYYSWQQAFPNVYTSPAQAQAGQRPGYEQQQATTVSHATQLFSGADSGGRPAYGGQEGPFQTRELIISKFDISKLAFLMSFPNLTFLILSFPNLTFLNLIVVHVRMRGSTHVMWLTQCTPWSTVGYSWWTRWSSCFLQPCFLFC